MLEVRPVWLARSLRQGNQLYPMAGRIAGETLHQPQLQ
jgi:hypothetical protein